MEITGKIKEIVIISDDVLGREGLRLMIEMRTNFSVIGEERICAEAVKLISRKQPDIVLLDANLNDENSAALLDALTAAFSGLRVLVLTSNCDTELHQQAIRSGAAGLFVKDKRCDILIKAIEKVIKGEIWIDKSLVRPRLAELRRSNLDYENERSKIASLTCRELEIITLICEGLRNQEIADRLFINKKTVSNQLTVIYSKLMVAHRLELSIYAQKHILISKNRNEIRRNPTPARG